MNDASAASVNTFALAMQRALGVAGNLAVSGLSVQACVAMLLAGAGGATRDELARATCLDDDARRAFGGLVSALESTRGHELRIANRVFVRTGLRLRADYPSPVELDFGQPEAARRVVNAWVSEITNGKIAELVPRGLIDPSVALILANALYLRARWEETFSPALPADFFVDGARVPVLTMQGAVVCRYGATDDFEIVSLPFQGGDLALVAIVPRDPRGLPGVERAVDASLLARAARLDEKEAIVSLPKFRIERGGLSLLKPLGALGVREAFDATRADFSGIAELAPGDPPLFVGEVLHKTYCAVDESGIEAAAATAVVMLGGAAPRPPKLVVRVDRPFFFAVQHVPSAACLFTGRVTDPRATEG